MMVVVQNSIHVCLLEMIYTSKSAIFVINAVPIKKSDIQIFTVFEKAPIVEGLNFWEISY